MKKLLGVIILFALVGCGESILPKDKEKKDYNVDSKAAHYMKVSAEGSRFYDEYGLLLPIKDGVHKDQGDALIWNSVTLAALCLTGSDNVAYLWESIKTLQTEDGRLFRHPIYADGVGKTSISKDGVLGFLYLGVIAKHTDCSPVEEEYGIMLAKFKDYVITHNYEMGVGHKDISVTFLSDRHTLRTVLRMYGISSEGLDFKTSVHDLSAAGFWAHTIFDLDYACQHGDANACSAKGTMGSFMNHLAFLSVSIAYYGSLYNEDSQYTQSQAKDLLKDMAGVGLDQKAYNWLFLTQLRVAQGGKTFKDVNKFLKESFPSDTPTETNGVKGWGCTDYIWQRAPYQPCENDAHYLGTDFLIVYGLINHQ